MPEGRIKLLSMFGVSSAALFPYFLKHYRGFGVEEFLLSLHYDPGQETARDAALALLERQGVRPRNVWTGVFAIADQERELNLLRQQHTQPQDWLVYADADEHHEFPFPLPALRRACRRFGKTYVMGRWIDRLADDGELKAIDARADLYAQFPWATHLSMSLGGKAFVSTTKLCFMAGDVFPSNAGFHRPKDRDWMHDPERWPGLIACHHFKWDESLRHRLQIRIRDWEVPNSIREANRIEDHVAQHGGRICLQDVEPRQRQCDKSASIRACLRTARFLRQHARACWSGAAPAATGGEDWALRQWCGIYR